MIWYWHMYLLPYVSISLSLSAKFVFHLISSSLLCSSSGYILLTHLIHCIHYIICFIYFFFLLIIIFSSWFNFDYIISYLLRINFGEGNGNPLQYFCLENYMDGGAWWAAVHGITKGRRWLSDFTTSRRINLCHYYLKLFYINFSNLLWMICFPVSYVILKVVMYLRCAFMLLYWRRHWHPTPVLLPGKSHGQRNLVGCSSGGR